MPPWRETLQDGVTRGRPPAHAGGERDQDPLQRPRRSWAGSGQEIGRAGDARRHHDHGGADRGELRAARAGMTRAGEDPSEERGVQVLATTDLLTGCCNRGHVRAPGACVVARDAPRAAAVLHHGRRGPLQARQRQARPRLGRRGAQGHRPAPAQPRPRRRHRRALRRRGVCIIAPESDLEGTAALAGIRRRSKKLFAAGRKSPRRWA